MDTAPNYIVVIGTSAGGFNALYELVSTLDEETNASYFIVLHLSARSIGGYLAHRLQEYTKLKCILAMDALPIRRGYIYVAVPNFHLTLTKDEVKLGRGPMENRWRPSIDVLFRSAAAHFTSRVIGVILTGMLNDGTTGMSAIKRSGGHTIVQDPNEAEYPDMPLSVLKSMEVDYCVPVSEMGEIIKTIAAKNIEQEDAPPDDVAQDARIFDKMITAIKDQEQYGNYTPYTCPDCGGVLFEHTHDAIVKLKCHVGHSFTIRDLMIKLTDELEYSLWFAVRSLEQKKNLMMSLEEKHTKTGNKSFATDYRNRAEEIEKHINNLKKMLMENLDSPEE